MRICSSTKLNDLNTDLDRSKAKEDITIDVSRFDEGIEKREERFSDGLEVRVGERK